MLLLVFLGLFHKAILQSGMAKCYWTLTQNAEARAFKLASILGNDSKDPKEVIEFLQTIPAADIVKVQYKVFTPQVNYSFYIFLFYFIFNCKH